MSADPGSVAGPRTGLLAEHTLDHTTRHRIAPHGRAAMCCEVRIGIAGPEAGPFTTTPITLAGRHLSLLLSGHDGHFRWLLMTVVRIALFNLPDRELDDVLVHGILQVPVLRGASLRVVRPLLPWRMAGRAGVISAAMLPYGCVPGRAVGTDARLVSPTHALSTIEGLA